MSAMRLMLTLFGLLLPLPGSAEQPLRVTTDSFAYCGELAQRVSAQAAAQQEPTRRMAEEGQRLCETGHVRTGIAKLRRA